ncbi:MAG TPA: nucleotide kinase domain-containing protein [Gaiellaceae bacterium]|nr:nucleotide kinase domain-containing protein [Gaiellaceae bacterium]
MLGRRDPVYRAYWAFAAKRQQAFLRRAAGDSPPWTDDSIINRFKFTNAYRASDRVSQFLIRDVIYRDGFSADDTLLRIVLFRLFSKTSTWQALERELGPIRRATISTRRLAHVLERLHARGPIYTSAFILCANDAYGHTRKFLNHIALVRDMFRARRLPTAVASARSLGALYEALLAYPLIGPFMGYQLAIDINYSELVDFDEDDFTIGGPGAERGIQKIFPTARRRDMTRIIQWMTDNQEAEAAKLGIELPTLYGRRLHAVDCQNLFCELDKYARVAFPELKSNRSRIKAAFTPSPEPLELFYPPKWCLNDRLPPVAQLQLGLAVAN